MSATPKPVDMDTPLRLADALNLAFPHGGLKLSSLRREIDKGTLEVELIAGKHFTTLRAIDRMRELCRERAKGRISGFDPSGGTPRPASSFPAPHGSSSTVDVKLAQEALRMRLEARKLR